MSVKENKKKKVIFTSLGLLAAGVLSYFGYQKYQQRKSEPEGRLNENANSFPDTSRIQLPQNTSVNSSRIKSITTGGSVATFPLKKGSKGEQVKALQDSLIAKYGKAILPKSGADGSFGNELIAALKKIGLPQEINESTFNVLTKGNSIDPNKVAETFYNSVMAKNFNQVLFTLRAMKNTNDYQMVSAAFQNYRINGGVRKTLVNGLLDSFSDAKQKEQIKLEFVRMGLRYDGNRWSLSGTP